MCDTDGMEPVFVAWFRSTFIKRRWTVLTPAGTFLAPAIQWLVNHVSAFPDDLRTASVWTAPWWLWVLCFMLCFSVAQILGWVEQHKMVRELSGRPDVTLEVRYNTHFLLKTNNVAAVDLTIQDIVIPFPARTTQRLEQLADATVRPEERSGVVFYDSWKIIFERLQAADQWPKPLPYRLPGVAIQDDIKVIFDQLISDVEVPLTLVFSNLGPPKRSWHSHYKLIYRTLTYGTKQLSVQHISIGEVKPGKTTCLCCQP
jgi:hypothetical protein